MASTVKVPRAAAAEWVDDAGGAAASGVIAAGTCMHFKAWASIAGADRRAAELRNRNAHVVARDGIAQDIGAGTHGWECSWSHKDPVVAGGNACRGSDIDAIRGVDLDQCRRNIHWARSRNQDRKRWNSGCKVQGGASQAVAISVRNGDRIDIAIAIPHSLHNGSIELPACAAAGDCHWRSGLVSAFAWIIVARAACFWFSGGVGWTCQRAFAAILDCPIHAELIPRTGAARRVDTAHHIAAFGVFTAGGGVQCCAAALSGETALHWWSSDAVEVSHKDAGAVPTDSAAHWINGADGIAACSVGARAITVGRCARSTGRGATQANAIGISGRGAAGIPRHQAAIGAYGAHGAAAIAVGASWQRVRGEATIGAVAAVLCRAAWGEGQRQRSGEGYQCG